jgi:hypothetical protein
LHVHRHGDVRDATIGKRHAARELHDVLDVMRAHHTRIVHAHIGEQLIELNVLLRERVEKIVELQASYGEHRLSIKLGIIEAVEKVNTAGSRRRQANTKTARPLGVGARTECSRLLVANLNEADIVFAQSERFDNAVDAVARQTKDSIHVPTDQSFNENIGSGGLSHGVLLMLVFAVENSRGAAQPTHIQVINTGNRDPFHRGLELSSHVPVGVLAR